VLPLRMNIMVQRASVWTEQGKRTASKMSWWRYAWTRCFRVSVGTRTSADMQAPIDADPRCDAAEVLVMQVGERSRVMLPGCTCAIRLAENITATAASQPLQRSMQSRGREHKLLLQLGNVADFNEREIAPAHAMHGLLLLLSR